MSDPIRVGPTPNPGGGIDIVPIPATYDRCSALAGLHYEAIDSELDTMVAARMSLLTGQHLRLVAAIPFTTVIGKDAILIITQDLDPHALPKEEAVR